jgi:hypothetical protein
MLAQFLFPANVNRAGRFQDPVKAIFRPKVFRPKMRQGEKL